MKKWCRSIIAVLMAAILLVEAQVPTMALVVSSERVMDLATLANATLESVTIGGESSMEESVVEESSEAEESSEVESSAAEESAPPETPERETSQSEVSDSQYEEIEKAKNDSNVEASEEEPVTEIAKDSAKDAAEDTSADAIAGGCLDFAKKAAEDIGKTKDPRVIGATVVGTVTTILEMGQDLYDLHHLTGENVMTQLTQLVVILADLMVLYTSLLGWIGFPWSLIIAFLVNFLADLVTDEDFVRKLDEWYNGIGQAINDFIYHNKLPFFINILKPNIYIYSDTSQNVDVTFTQPHLLTTSIPDYNTGWSVTTGSEGQLTDTNGEAYEFLFYESKSRPDLFQTEEGYRIAASTRAEQFKEILMEMGFNEKEIADFIEFWTAKLDAGVDYIMYPQDTTTIDIAMPIEITPQPKSIERIWFYFIADEGQSIETPETMILERDAEYSVVEWGGMVKDK